MCASGAAARSWLSHVQMVNIAASTTHVLTSRNGQPGDGSSQGGAAGAAGGHAAPRRPRGRAEPGLCSHSVSCNERFAFVRRRADRADTVCAECEQRGILECVLAALDAHGEVESVVLAAISAIASLARDGLFARIVQ
jgi:hypothetical protein